MCFGGEKSESMKDNMSAKEKKQRWEKIWEKMMPSCCSEMTDEEKHKWMKDMPEMIQHVKEFGGPMMGMMMAKMHGKGEKFMPWDM